MGILEDGDRIRAGLIAGNLGSTETTWQSAAISLAEMIGATYPYDHVTPAGWLTFAKANVGLLKGDIAVMRLALEEAANELFKCPQSSTVVLNQVRAALMKGRQDG